MTTFIAFTETRKKQIDHLRERLITERPYIAGSGIYISKVHPLGLTEYAVYAALRGADYRKGDHTGGKEATQALQHVITTWNGCAHVRRGLLPDGSTVQEIQDFIEVLGEELAKWKDAPVVTAADASAFGPAVDRAINSSNARRADLAAFGATQSDKGEAK